MPHITVLFLAFLVMATPQALAGSQKALTEREANSLIPYSPPARFLDGYFLAEEMAPSYLFGTVKRFASSRPCPVAWFIEKSEQERLEKASGGEKPVEYTLWLEEDCPQGPVYYVFVDQSAMTPAQWIEWRRQFHKNKAEKEYGETKDRLEQAVTGGMAVAGELRFIMTQGAVSCAKTPEAALPQDMGYKPSYDLKQGTKLAN